VYQVHITVFFIIFIVGYNQTDEIKKYKNDKSKSIYIFEGVVQNNDSSNAMHKV